MNESPLTRADLEALGIPAGQTWGLIFKATRGMTKEIAAVIALQINAGTWVPPERKSVKILVGSVWDWMVTHPSFEGISRSECRRMIEQGAIRINWHNDWKPDDAMPAILTELTIFPSGDRRTLLWCITCGPSCPHATEMKDDLERARQKEEERKARTV